MGFIWYLQESPLSWQWQPSLPVSTRPFLPCRTPKPLTSGRACAWRSYSERCWSSPWWTMRPGRTCTGRIWRRVGGRWRPLRRVWTQRQIYWTRIATPLSQWWARTWYIVSKRFSFILISKKAQKKSRNSWQTMAEFVVCVHWIFEKQITNK